MCVPALVPFILGCTSSMRNAPEAPEASLHCNLQLYGQRYPLFAERQELVPDSTLDSPLDRVSGPPLRYPVALRDAQVQGWVVMAMVIVSDGSVADAKVMASSHPDFEPPAQVAVEGSHFTLPRRLGQPVWAFKCQTLRFLLRYGGE